MCIHVSNTVFIVKLHVFSSIEFMCACVYEYVRIVEPIEEPEGGRVEPEGLDGACQGWTSSENMAGWLSMQVEVSPRLPLVLTLMN